MLGKEAKLVAIEIVGGILIAVILIATTYQNNIKGITNLYTKPLPTLSAQQFKSSPGRTLQQSNQGEPFGPYSWEQEALIESEQIKKNPEPYIGIKETITPEMVALSSGDQFLHWPVNADGFISQCYQWPHNGIDIAVPMNSPIVAASPGVVTFAGCQSGSCPLPGKAIGGKGLAWAVIVDHGNGLSTIYGHMNSISVAPGQLVDVGYPLGASGMSGTATGPHLHFMVVKTGTYSHLNPEQYLINKFDCP